MLWLGLHFAAMPLEIFARGTPQPGPLAVVSRSGGSTRIVACNPPAQARGIKPGMALAAAWALAADLATFARDARAEAEAIERIAAWALQFTPLVHIAGTADVLLEIEGSLKLFGGLEALCARIRNGLRGLGYAARHACAPTPRAAQLLARAGLAARITNRETLRAALGRLPVALLGHDPAVAAALDGFGVRTLAECLRLPRAGFARRLGTAVLLDLDRAFGDLPDPRKPHVPPSGFRANLPLPAPVDDAQALLFATRRLIDELCGLLAATMQGARQLLFSFAHDDGPDTTVTLSLVAASRDPGHLAGVLRERLHRVELPCPTTAVALAVEAFVPLAAGSRSFLPETGQHAAAAARLVERLRARLGEDTVVGLRTAPDHRPERAWCLCEPGHGAGPPDGAGRLHRPLWLLPAPQPIAEIAAIPQYGGPLALIAGPERIETGWWDDGFVARDYFIARNNAQVLVWIFRVRAWQGRWYLHGIFS